MSFKESGTPFKKSEPGSESGSASPLKEHKLRGSTKKKGGTVTMTAESCIRRGN